MHGPPKAPRLHSTIHDEIKSRPLRTMYPKLIKACMYGENRGIVYRTVSYPYRVARKVHRYICDTEWIQYDTVYGEMGVTSMGK